MWLGQRLALKFITQRALALGLECGPVSAGVVVALGRFECVIIEDDIACVERSGLLTQYRLMDQLEFYLFTYSVDEILLRLTHADPASLDMMDIPADEVRRPCDTASQRLLRHLWQPEDHMRIAPCYVKDIKVGKRWRWRPLQTHPAVYAAAHDIGLINLIIPFEDPQSFRCLAAPALRFGDWGRTLGSKHFLLIDEEERVLAMATTRSGRILDVWGLEQDVEFSAAVNVLSQQPMIAYP